MDNNKVMTSVSERRRAERRRRKRLQRQRQVRRNINYVHNACDIRIRIVYFIFIAGKKYGQSALI